MTKRRRPTKPPPGKRHDHRSGDALLSMGVSKFNCGCLIKTNTVDESPFEKSPARVPRLASPERNDPPSTVTSGAFRRLGLTSARCR